MSDTTETTQTPAATETTSPPTAPTTPAPQPVIFQLAPPIAQPAQPPQPPTPTPPTPPTTAPADEPDYKGALGRYASAALAGLSEGDRQLVEQLSSGDPIKTLDVLASLQASGKIGQAAAPAPSAPTETAQPTETQPPTPPVPVDRGRAGGGDAIAPPPSTPEEASRRLAQQLRGHTLAW